MKKDQLKMGVVLAYISLAVNNLSALLYTPFMLRTMGQAEYGLYSLCYSFVNYLTVLDFGLGNAVIRYVAKYRKCGGELEKSQINGMFLTIYFAIGIVATIIGVIIYFCIDVFFAGSLTVAEIKKAKIIVIILLINIILSFPLSVFSSILTAYEKFIFIRAINIIRTLLLPCIMIPLLLFGYKSITMSIVVTVLNIIVLTISAVYCKFAIKVKFNFSRMDTSIVKEIINYSFYAFLLLIVDKINWSTDQVIIGKVTSIRDVAVYSVASQISFIYLAFPTAISGVMLPKLSMLATNKNNDKAISDIFLKISRLQLYIAIYILFGFIFIGKDFIKIWAGTGYEQAYYIAAILMSSAAIPLALNIGNVILQAKNMQKFRAVILVLVAFSNVLISIPLAQRYGAIGCTFGTAISYILGHLIIMTVYFKKRVNLDMNSFWINTVKIMIPCIGALLLSSLLNLMLTGVNIFNVCIKGIVYSIIFSFAIYMFCGNEYEKNIIKNVVVKLVSKLHMRSA